MAKAVVCPLSQSQGKTSQEEVDPTVRDVAQGQAEGQAQDLLFLDVQFSYVRAG